MAKTTYDGHKNFIPQTFYSVEVYGKNWEGLIFQTGGRTLDIVNRSLQKAGFEEFVCK